LYVVLHPFALLAYRKSALPRRNKDLEHSEHFHEVHDPFLFSAPPFTAPRKHAIKFFPRSICSPTRSTHAPLLLRCAVWDLWFDNVCSRMRVRGPAHGMQGVLGKYKKRYVLRFSHSLGGSDAKDAFRHAASKDRRSKGPKAARAERERCRDTEKEERILDQETGMPTRLSDESPQKTRILNIQNVFMKYTILSFFCTAVHSAAQACQGVICSTCHYGCS
jgi:hypothetical protein